LLDSALTRLNMTPALLFKTADKDRSGTVDLKELETLLVDLFETLKQRSPEDAIQREDILKIVNHLDSNGNRELEENEFLELIKLARAKNQTGSLPS